MNRAIVNFSSKDRMWEEKKDDVFWKRKGLTMSSLAYKSLHCDLCVESVINIIESSTFYVSYFISTGFNFFVQ